MMNPDEGGWTDWLISLQLQKKSFVFPLFFLYCEDAIYAHGKRLVFPLDVPTSLLTSSSCGETGHAMYVWTVRMAIVCKPMDIDKCNDMYYCN
jgi:hypothetical protein